MPFDRVIPVVDLRVRGLCVKPYPNHPGGCPNFNKKPGCPPAAPRLTEAFDLEQPCYAIWTSFNFGAHVAAMRVKHPDWSQRQLECCLYWQPKARKLLEAVIAAFRQAHNTNETCLRVERCPEAMGLDVTATMAKLGVVLEWPPQHYTTHVAFAGTPR